MPFAVLVAMHFAGVHSVMSGGWIFQFSALTPELNNWLPFQFLSVNAPDLKVLVKDIVPEQVEINNTVDIKSLKEVWAYVCIEMFFLVDVFQMAIPVDTRPISAPDIQ